MTRFCLPMRLPTALLAFLVAAAPVTAQEDAAMLGPDFGAQVAKDYVRPAIADFTRKAEGLALSVAALCAAPDKTALDAARDRFAAVVVAWGRLSIVRFGPLIVGNRFERLFFWPDPRGVTLRQVEGLLADEDAGALTVGGLAEKSVALQGLPALEFVLYGNGAEALATPEESYRCRYGEAVAGNIASLADGLAADWAQGTAFAESFTAPAPDRDPYRSLQEVAGELVKALGTGLQFVANAELKPALGETIKEARGRRAPLWRSNLTFALVVAQIDGLRDLLAAKGREEILPGEALPIVESITFDLDRAVEAVASIGRSAEAAFEDEEDWEKLRYVTVVLDYANRTVSERLAGALGLVMGFNALDGD